MSFHLSRHGQDGAFESLNRQLFSCSIYEGWVYEVSKLFGPDGLKDRKIVMDFYEQKFPKMACVPGQNFKGSEARNLVEFSYTLARRIRGMSINYKRWSSQKDYQDWRNDTLRLESPLYDIFDKTKVLELSKSGWSQFEENFLKYAYIIDSWKNGNSFDDSSIIFENNQFSRG